MRHLHRCLFTVGILGLTLTGSLLWGQEPSPEFATIFTHWKAAPQTPLFTGRGEGHWDVKIRERGWILKEGDSWSLWYTGYDGTREGLRKLGYATSPDGFHWTRWSQQPLDNENWIEDVHVTKLGDTYYMFAEGYQDQAQLLTSKDRVHWHREGTLDIHLTTGEKISPGPFGTPVGFHENGVWYLFYERRDAGVWVAQSTDLKTWKHLQDAPILIPGPSAYDSQLIAMNQVVKHEGKYYGVYHATKSITKPSLWTTNLAVSEDLLHWKKYPGNPLTPESENKSSGQIVFDGERFRLYTMHDKVEVHFPVAR